MIPDFFDFLLYPSSCSKIASGELGRPLKVFEAKITICNFFVKTKNKKSIFHVDLTSKLNPVYLFPPFSFIPAQRCF